jgi:hypothetical protein
MLNFSDFYQRNLFINFLKNILPFEENQKQFIINKNELIKNVLKLGDIPFDKNITVFEVKHNSKNDTRAQLTKSFFSILNKFSIDQALVVFFCDDSKKYRLSFIESELNWSSVSSLKREFSNPKRLSYLLGEGAKIHTAYNQLKNKIIDYNDLKKRFDIEIVSKEFFNQYKNLYENLLIHLNNDKQFKKFANKIDLEINFFSKKLLGQIIFCYFLQKKGWLGVELDKKFGNGDFFYLRNKFTEASKKNYNFYNNFLEPFFYDGLNRNNENNFVKSINSKVPYIGGGLFEYYEGYDWKKENLSIPNEVFSNSGLTGILDIFDLYNFTVDEHDPLDIEIGVDPEMLGKVFESLLPENIRSKGGIFYTPRTVVEYMSYSTLFDYLDFRNEKRIDRDELINFVFDKNFLILPESTLARNSLFLDEILLNIKICDPAVGSGAFAVSLMNLIVNLRIKLTPYTNRKYKNTAYYFKKDCIQNSIYGVDLDQYAVEITRLRLWLSLIVDQKDYDITESLPNLDFKIIQGNSLLEEFENVNLGSNIFNKSEKNYSLFSNDIILEQKIKKIAEVQSQYFKTISYSKKKNLKEEIQKLMLSVLSEVVDSSVFENLKSKNDKNSLINIFSINTKRNFFPWGIFFAEVFYNNKGFDIVIGNPPYVDSEVMVRNDKSLREKYSTVYKSAKGNWDLYIIFIELGIKLLSKNGFLSFIVKNTLIASRYSEEIRRIMTELNIIEIRDYSTVEVFKEADVYPVIFRLQNSKIKNNLINMTVMEDINLIKDKNLIKKDLFYKNIMWDYYFFNSNYVKIINKILEQNFLNDPYVCSIISACTVGEAYKIKEILLDKNSPEKPNYKLINSGTIDPYCTSWGIDMTQYIKDRYQYPVVNINKLKNISENRAQIAQSRKLIIANMTIGLECFYDKKGEYVPGKSTTVILSGKSSVPLEVLASLLNSKLVKFFILIYFNSLKMQGGSINFGSEQIGQIPFPKKIKKQNRLMELVNQILIIKSKNYDAEINELTQEIDNIIFENFDLDDQEIKYIEKFISKFN